MQIRSLAVTACFLLAGAGVSAQSLGETYAAMCADPKAAQGEACLVMARAMAQKLQGQAEAGEPAVAGGSPQATNNSTPPAQVGGATETPVGNARWGVFADVVDVPLVDFLVESPEMQLFEPAVLMYTWEVPGEVMAVSIQQDDGTFHKVSTLRWDEARRGLVDSSMPAGSPVLLAWQPGGSFVMDLGGARVTWSPLPDRVIELRAEVDKGQGLQVHWVQQRVEATPANVKAARDAFALMKQIAANMADTQALMATIQRQDAALKASPLWQQTLVNRANAEAERARKRASGSNGLQIFGAILQGLSQGMAQSMPEYTDGPYDAYGPVGSFDRAAANMTATVDGIQRQAAAERAQQAGFQAPAVAAGTGRHAIAAPVQEHGMAGGTTPSPTPYAALEGPGTGAWAGAGKTASGGQASTRDDSSTCVSPPVTSTHQCASLSGYKARVSNNCAAPVDMRVCFMTDAGWNCQANYGVAPGGDWEPGWCHASTGEVFHSSRYSDSSDRLASP